MEKSSGVITLLWFKKHFRWTFHRVYDSLVFMQWNAGVYAKYCHGLNSWYYISICGRFYLPEVQYIALSFLFSCRVYTFFYQISPCLITPHDCHHHMAIYVGHLQTGSISLMLITSLSQCSFLQFLLLIPWMFLWLSYLFFSCLLFSLARILEIFTYFVLSFLYVHSVRAPSHSCKQPIMWQQSSGSHIRMGETMWFQWLWM